MDAVTRRSFVENEDRVARKAARRWVREPAVSELVRAWSEQVGSLLAPVNDLLVGDGDVAHFTMRGLGINTSDPDGVEHSWPLAYKSPAHLQYLATGGLPNSEAAAEALAAACAHAWILFLRFVAHSLAERGVPLDPGPPLTDAEGALISPWTTRWDTPDGMSVDALLADRQYNIGRLAASVPASDLVVLAQLLTCQVPWSAPTTIIDDDFNVIGLSAVSRDGRSVIHRDGRSLKDQGGVLQWQKWYRSQQPDDRSSFLADPGGRPSIPTLQYVTMKQVLRELLPKYPDVTAASLRKGWKSGRQGDPGRLLREAMREALASIHRRRRSDGLAYPLKVPPELGE